MGDLRDATRALLRRPATTVLATAVLALGIGANITVFGVVDAVLFRPLPVERPEQLVRLYSATSRTGGDLGRISRPFFEDYRTASSFAALAMWSEGLPVDAVVKGRAPERLGAAVVSPAFFDMLGVKASQGRLLGFDEPHDEGTVVLSHRLWLRAFEGDPRAIGATLRINRQEFVIVGVAPRGFEGLGLEKLPDLWLPLSQVAIAMPAWREQTQHRASAFFHAVARLAPGIDRRAAQAELEVIASRVGAGRPARAGPEVEDPGWLEPWPWLEPAQSVAGRSARPLAHLLVGVAALVLALAAADVAGLMLARSESRRSEIALRMALGGQRWRVVRPIALEALLVSAAGGLFGLLTAHVVTQVLLASAPAALGLPLAAADHMLGLRVLAATVLVSVLVAGLTGLWPALQAGRVNPLPGLRGDPPVGTARWLSMRGGLVVLQVAVATVLLIGMGSLLRSLWTAARIAPGLAPRPVVVAGLDLARGGYDKTGGAEFASRLDERLRNAPGLSAAALSVGMPLQSGPRTSVAIDGASVPVDFAMITPGYFETLGIPVLQGRGIERRDQPGAASVVVVNQAFVQRFWPDGEGSALSRTVSGFTPRGALLEVVGVVKDVRTHGLREPPHPMMYVPLAQFYDAFPWQFGLTVLLRAQQGPSSTLPVLRRHVAALDPLLPLLQPRPLTEAVGESFAEQRFLAGLLGGFAILAVVLAGAGLYGVVALAAARRTREFGVRLALGARPAQLRRLVLRRSLPLTGLGLAAGLAGGFVGAQALRPFVFGVSATDPWAIAGSLLGLLALSLLAADAPAVRAARVDPAHALRHH